ncbi:MAG: prepilin-type N-terminal cleavage/methylation domain-containing protein [Planctomycetota bacterium]|nr:prepilin-type N-terminal cleavage/methylation domain-containing protein [Planctomycetota bacterium]
MTRRPRAQAGFSFIEILVVMGIISVLVSMVVVVVPMVQERGNRTKSVDNLRSLALIMNTRATEKGGWKTYPFSGKNFTLGPLAYGELDRRNKQNLEILFSPGDQYYGIEEVDLERYKQVTKDALRRGNEGFEEMTSYAGRRNGDKDFRITQDDVSRGVMILCDDDEGPIHHKAGFVAAYTNGAARFHEWADFDLIEPDDPKRPDPWLGDDAKHPDLEALSSR